MSSCSVKMNFPSNPGQPYTALHRSKTYMGKQRTNLPPSCCSYISNNCCQTALAAPLPPSVAATRARLIKTSASLAPSILLWSRRRVRSIGVLLWSSVLDPPTAVLQLHITFKYIRCTCCSSPPPPPSLGCCNTRLIKTAASLAPSVLICSRPHVRSITISSSVLHPPTAPPYKSSPLFPKRPEPISRKKAPWNPPQQQSPTMPATHGRKNMPVEFTLSITQKLLTKIDICRFSPYQHQRRGERGGNLTPARAPWTQKAEPDAGVSDSQTLTSTPAPTCVRDLKRVSLLHQQQQH